MSASKYSGRLFPMQIGQLISVVGKISNNPDRLDIDLTSGNEPSDIILHISARFPEDEAAIVRNTRDGENWGEEERAENLIPFNGLNPLKPGGDFKIDIFIDEAAYFISIDGKPFCTYSHRMPFEAIQKINISSDIEAVYQVNQTSAQERPWPAVNVNTFEAFVPEQFNPGNIVVISGIPKGNNSGDFAVNFYDGSNRSRCHFHFRAFLADNSAILNSQNENYEWHQEISSSHPFQICEPFKLAIAMTNNEFQVAINGEKVGALPYIDHHERLFGSLTGISVVSNNGLNVEVQGVNYMKLGADCERFEAFSRI